MNISLSLLDPGFVGLLALTGLLRTLIPRRFYIAFGVLASAALLGTASPATLVAISATTLLFVLPLHWLIRAAESRGCSSRTSSLLLLSAICGLVALMIGFKLHRHFSLPWMESPRLSREIAGLIGFSYFIFKAIGFLHIQTILKATERSPSNLLFFTLFPPTITSGPIQKFQDFKIQASNPAPLTRATVWAALYRITRGYFRKMVLAVGLNQVVEHLLAIPQPTVLVTIAAIVLLYLFFYYDFSGYSDIAIGFGLLLGIKVPENFKRPFHSTTASEFWRNWHITLADWFRDHVFIPFGGMRNSRFAAASLAFVIMFLCGLWHGLTLSFVAWGIWHGLVLFSEGVSGTKPIPPANRHGPHYWMRVIWTNGKVAFGAVFFLPFDVTIRLLSGFLRWGIV
jgi:alginate O-acetyltransferase complex protein AlgI